MFLDYQSGYAVYLLGSGKYNFEAPASNSNWNIALKNSFPVK
jgi:hypothetical protein